MRNSPNTDIPTRVQVDGGFSALGLWDNVCSCGATAPGWIDGVGFFPLWPTDWLLGRRRQTNASSGASSGHIDPLQLFVAHLFKTRFYWTRHPDVETSLNMWDGRAENFIEGPWGA